MLADVYGPKVGQEILLVAWRSLTLEERAAIGLLFMLEEQTQAEAVANALRAELGRQLPAESSGCKPLKGATP